MQRRDRFPWGAAVAVAVVAMSGFAGIAPAAATTAATHHRVALRATATTGTGDPAANVAPSPDYWPTCTSDGPTSAACTSAVVTAIDHARALEGVGPLQLPTGFAGLTVAQQTFVISNLERVDRGLPPAVGMVDSLNSVAADAAARDADPVLDGWTVGPFNANSWGSIWAGDLNPLAADYDWMYDDGWGPSGSYNIDCTSAGAAGCWGHRHNILSTYGGGQVITGVGSVTQTQWTSIAQLFVAGSGTLPPFTFSWSDVVGTPATVTSTPPPTTSASPDVTRLSLRGPAAVDAGAVAHLTGSVVDGATGAVIPAAPLELCRRAAASTTTTCAPASSDERGLVGVDVRPLATTTYWLRYRGDAVHAAAVSRGSVVQARPRVRLRLAHTSSGWRVVAALTPVHAQTVRLQRHTSAGWVTVRKATAAPRLVWSRLRSGTYRVVVTASRTTATAVARAVAR